jgi:DNA-binding CsgD family transcriptional regulator
VSVNAEWPIINQGWDIPFSLRVGQVLIGESASTDDANMKVHIARAVRSALAGELPLPVTIQIPSKPPATFSNSEVAIWSHIDDKCLCVGAVVAYYEKANLVMQGMTACLPVTLDAAAPTFATTGSCEKRFSRLTAAEWRVLRELVTHRTIKEIADRLSVSPHTVKTQVTSIYGKLGVTHRSEAVDLLYGALHMSDSA